MKMLKNHKIYWLLAIVAFVLFACVFSACSSIDNKPSYNIKDYVIDAPYKENFKILQLTDTHWKGQEDWFSQEQVITNVVQNSEASGKPDFIVITGDCVNYGTYDDWKNYCDFIDTFKIPWTLTFGNHDSRSLTSTDGLTSYLNERSASGTSYLKFINNIGDDIYGDANFAINLKDGDKIKEQLIVLDSNRYVYDDSDQNAYVGDDCIHLDQVEWYENLVNWTTEQNNGNVVPSLAFFHIPLQEYLFAYDQVLKGENKFLDEGMADEGICCSKRNEGLFEKMKALNSTKGVFCGHDHVNSFNINYQGINLVYGLKSSTDNYHNDGWIGGRQIYLKNDGSFDSSLIKVG